MGQTKRKTSQDKQRRKRKTKTESRSSRNYWYRERARETLEAVKRHQQAIQQHAAPVEQDSSDSDENGEETSKQHLQVLMRSIVPEAGSSGQVAIDSDDSDGEDEPSDEAEERSVESDDGSDSTDDEFGMHDTDTEPEDDEQLDGKRSNKNANDPFVLHLSGVMSEGLVNSVTHQPPVVRCVDRRFPSFGKVTVEIPREPKDNGGAGHRQENGGEPIASEGTIPKVLNAGQLNWKDLFVKEKLMKNVNFEPDALQCDILSVLSNYQDLYYYNRTLENGEQIRTVYCLHLLNHIMKTTSSILHHNVKLQQNVIDLKKSKKKKKKTGNASVAEVHALEFRDQGFVRPKVLVLVPFRDSALRIVNLLKQLFTGDNPKAVTNYKRFVNEYSGETLYFPKVNPKPEDYVRTFAGNTEDNFRLGVAFSKSSMKLYTKFYSSDLIIASPLGLRMAVGVEDEEHSDFNFLSSIEVLIVDQAELCLAQNWSHLVHVLDNLNRLPKDTEHTDFSRVRTWSLNGWAKHYRQTLLLTTHDLPEFRAAFNGNCANYRGRVLLHQTVKLGAVQHLVVAVPQQFHRVTVKSIATQFEDRFNQFVNVVLPQCRNVMMARCLIYVPSYFDYVRLRNYLKKQEISFVQICEYSKDYKIARARDMFYHGSAHFLLYSERSHFFRRPRIKGIRHLVLYQLPAYPHLYAELVNFMSDKYQNPDDGIDPNSMTVTAMYTRYDLARLSNILGHKRATEIMSSNQTIHTFSLTQ